MSCAYITGLADNNVDLADAENLSSRGAAALAGVGKSTVNNHRAGTCACGQDTTPDVTDPTPEPTGRRDSVELGPDGGSLVYHTTDPEPIRDWSDVLQHLGVDPDKWSVVGDTVRVSRWQQSSKEGGTRDSVWLSAYRASITPKRTHVDLSGLIEHVRSVFPTAPKIKIGIPVTAVIALADWQLGKTEEGSGGTPETVDRIKAGLAAAREYIETQRANGYHIERVVLANMGDHIEATHGSYASQAGSVDLNLRDQLSLALELNMAWITAMREYAPVTYTATLCNHGVFSRVGHDSVTGDSDNATGFIGDQLQAVCKYSPALQDVEFVIPRSEMITTTRVSGVNLAMAHGHKISGREDTWLATQSQALTHRERFIPDLWLTAHRHHAQVTDYGPYTRIQATTVDPGSKWLFDLKGVYSTPGTTVFLTGEHLPMKWAKYEVL